MNVLADHGIIGGNANPLYKKSYFNKMGTIILDATRIPKPENVVYLGDDKILVVAEDKTSFVYSLKGFAKSTPTGNITNLPSEITTFSRLLELGDYFGVCTQTTIIIYSKATQSKVKELPYSSTGTISDVFYVDKDISLLIVARASSAECFHFNKTTLSITNKVTFNSRFPVSLQGKGAGAFVENDFLYCFDYDYTAILIFNWKDGKLVQSKSLPFTGSQSYYGFGRVGNRDVAVIWSDLGNETTKYFSIYNKTTLTLDPAQGIVYVRAYSDTAILKQEKLRNFIVCDRRFVEIHKPKKIPQYAVNYSMSEDNTAIGNMMTFDNDKYAYAVNSGTREITIYRLVRE
ncbi:MULTISPECIES: hypothetical protein [Bacillus cereus group]|uniref:hypothetical protein n=1 Tax=Bacillus cereus group TaxID=86661 RepID=UPI0002D4BF58|nr:MULTISPECIES: hypothetical protein [Bacillus cereus group]MDA2665556.1 hypothetical protein [Bacillus cereus group sp. Bc032]MDA2676342.1 hypothetical protein [Bacillus cereus group sp. Bc031]MDA2681812.1 hypothetical protein [Bacillus cereus group sp. Bc029]MDA2687268.1 hypothetical protein [Bacillus cereus group sp. Bc030]MDA2742756.1 hypothetical protein [Bacillus cereus group sp. Bc011]